MAENTNSSYSEYLKKKLAEKTGQAQKNNAEIEKQVSELPTPAHTKLKKAVEEEQPKKEENPKAIVPTWKDSIKDDNRSTKNIKREKSTTESRSVAKTIGIVFLSIVMAVVLIVGGYFAYLQMSFSRIEDMKYLEVSANQSSRVVRGTQYSISTFNIGFGAYSQSYSFFMDEGMLENGTATKGEYARGISEEDIRNNMSGIINLVKTQANSDFYFFQEVDTDSTRSYYVNQLQLLNESFPSYGSVYGVNAHSAYLFYPLNQPTGKINSGILTLSKYNIDYSLRRSLEIDMGMIDKLFDLDRCFTVTKLPISGAGAGKYLVLVNVHLSAYDDGDIREKQIAMIYDYINYEYNENHNYVIVGGDFNLSLAGDYGVFNNGMKTPTWCKNLPVGYQESNFNEIGFSVNYDISTTTGTCRDASIKYTEGVNLEVVIDGFITSGNISVVTTSVIDGEYKNSDHNPVRMEFILN